MSRPVPSMTGFGTARGTLSDRFAVGVVIRGVNHRYLDVQVRFGLREDLPEVEFMVRREVERVASRGRVSVQVDFQRLAAPENRVLLNRKGLDDLAAQLSGLDVTAGQLLSVPGVVDVSSASLALEDDEIDGLRGVVREAVAVFDRMRHEEGARLAGQVRSDLAEVGTFLDWFEPQMETFRVRIFERLRARLVEMLEGRDLDEDRLVHEAAMQADKADVAEEVVRLRAHLASFDRRLDESGPVGRALDFLCQEIHREINTLGTKCRELGVADRVVDAKGAVERVREQVQNLE